MSAQLEKEIYSERILNAPLELVYCAFVNPIRLAKWWGPEGFTNTIHEFDLRVGGKWLLTMHGPEKGNYENESIFESIVPLKSVAWTRITKPLFNMKVGFEKWNDSQTKIIFQMIFATAEECQKIKPYATPKNEENFDRLERVLQNL